MTLRTAAALTLLMGISIPVAAMDLVTCVRDHIDTNKDWSANFTQSQHISVLSTPLESNGRVSLQSGSIRWEVLAPIPQILTIDAKGQITSDDGASMDHPAIATTIRMLLSMDTVALQKTFVIKGRCEDQSWSLQLAPREETLATLFSSIDVSGANTLDTVVLTTRSGDFTRIRFLPSEAVRSSEATAP